MTRLLLLSPVAPWPPDTGARQRTFLLWQALRETHEVDLLLIGGDAPPAAERAVLARDFGLIGHLPDDPGRLGVRHWVFPWPLIGTPLRRLTRLALGARRTLFRSPRLAAALDRVLSAAPPTSPAPPGYAAIVSRYLWPAVQTDAFARAPVWVDIDDLDSEIWDTHARRAERRPGPAGACARHIARSYRAAEARQLARCQAAWVTKTRDRAAVDGRPVALLPNIPLAAWPQPIEPVPWPAGSQAGPVVLGIALYDHPPNREGYDWFVRTVWPRVRARQPQARLRLVGRLSCARTRAAWQAVPGVELAGRLEDLRPAYAASTVTVAPLFSGGGTNIKVIESLAHGRACVLTPHAAKGFDALDGLWVRERAEDFAAACVDLLADPARARQLGAAGAAAAARDGSWSRFRDGVHALLPTATGGPR